MPLGRAARQARQRPTHKPGKPWSPRVDVYGTLRLPDTTEMRARLIEYAPQQFAAFTTDVENPITFRTDGDFVIKGRILTATLQNAGSEVKFQKAGCGCETPHELRGSRNKLLIHLPDAQTEEPGTQELPTFNELTEQLAQLPGTSV